VSELQTVVAERVIEKTALDRAWVLTRLRENVDCSMQVTAVLDSEGNPAGVYQHQPMAADKGLELIERFKASVGLAPKHYCRILRFQRALARAEQGCRRLDAHCNGLRVFRPGPFHP